MKKNLCALNRDYYQGIIARVSGLYSTISVGAWITILFFQFALAIPFVVDTVSNEWFTPLRIITICICFILLICEVITYLYIKSCKRSRDVSLPSSVLYLLTFLTLCNIPLIQYFNIVDGSSYANRDLFYYFGAIVAIIGIIELIAALVYYRKRIINGDYLPKPVNRKTLARSRSRTRNTVIITVIVMLPLLAFGGSYFSRFVARQLLATNDSWLPLAFFLYFALIIVVGSTLGVTMAIFSIIGCRRKNDGVGDANED